MSDLITGVPSDLQTPAAPDQSEAQAQEVISQVPTESTNTEAVAPAEAPAVIDAVPGMESTTPVAEVNRDPVVIPEDEFKGDPSRVPGHPSNPNTPLVQEPQAPQAPEAPADQLPPQQ
ncbi:MAG: hypothetical protein QG553_46 [Patescibacteria group bacterium]|nr:hypothetical protein [Patescibacteria group bacterium]